MHNIPLYDQIRKIASDHLDASVELQEALITWYQTRADEYLRAERRLTENGASAIETTE